MLRTPRLGVPTGDFLPGTSFSVIPALGIGFRGVGMEEGDFFAGSFWPDWAPDDCYSISWQLRQLEVFISGA